MRERDPLRVQTERGVAHGEGLGFSNNAISQVGRVADDRETKMPEMNADLIGAGCRRTRRSRYRRPTAPALPTGSQM